MKRVVIITFPGIFVLVFGLLVESCSDASQEQSRQAANVGFQFKEKLSDYGFFVGDIKQLKPRAYFVSL
jgi:hypothetical protein